MASSAARPNDSNSLGITRTSEMRQGFVNLLALAEKNHVIVNSLLYRQPFRRRPVRAVAHQQ